MPLLLAAVGGAALGFLAGFRSTDLAKTALVVGAGYWLIQRGR